MTRTNMDITALHQLDPYRWTHAATADLKQATIILFDDKTLLDVRITKEAPGAYKDVDPVATATEHAKLAKRVAFLRPKICIKG